MAVLRKIGDLVEEESRLITVEDEIEYRCGGVRLHGSGAFVREFKMGIDIKKKLVQHVARTGDIIYSTLFAKHGAFAVVEAAADGCIFSEKFPTFRLVDERVSRDYLAWFFKSGQLNRIAEDQATGIASFSLSHLSKSKFLNLRVPVPSADRQLEVINLCKAVDELVRGAGPLVKSSQAFSGHLVPAAAEKLFKNMPSVEISTIGDYAIRPAEIVPDKQYSQITVAMNHRGLRLRRVCTGIEILSPGQCFVKEGDILFSRIDIRQGAIGFVSRDLEGAVVTRDFPIFVLNKPTELASRFLAYVFQSPSFMAQAQEASRGTTGRQKLKRDRFLKFSVPWPKSENMKEAVEKLDAVGRDARKFQEIIRAQKALFEKLGEAVVEKAFAIDSGFETRARHDGLDASAA